MSIASLSRDLSLLGFSGGGGGGGGNVLRNGNGTPDPVLGVDGDYYIANDTMQLFGPKAGGIWPSGVSLVGDPGSSLLTGTTAPTGGVGSDGDAYLDTVNATLYGPKDEGVWPAGIPLVGPTGPTGSSWSKGAVAPTTGDGEDGDMYLEYTQYLLYGPKAGGAWPTGRKLFLVANVKDFGALGDGVADDASAMQSALSSGAKVVYMPEGRYRVGSTLTVPTGVSLFGEGPGASVIDASGASFASLTDGRVLTTPRGTLTALPALSGDLARHGRTVSFASAPTVSPNDVVVVFNATNGSWHADRTYYRAGEFARVSSVSGNTVTLQGTLCDDYVAASVTVYRLTGASSCRLQDFSIKGLPSTVNQTYGLVANHLVDSVISNVQVSDCSYMCIAVWNGYNVQVNGCNAFEDTTSNFGGDYGLAIVNSHIVNVNGGEFSASRHGFAITGAGNTGDVPNRFIRVDKAHISTNKAGSIHAADLHGNCEFVSVTECTLDGGIIMAGDHTSLKHNIIKCAGLVGVFYSEMKGFSHEVLSNTLISDGTSDAARGLFVDVGGDGDGLTANSTRGGTFVFDGNTMILDMDASNDGLYPMRFANRGYAGSEPLNLVISNNRHCSVKQDVRVGYGSVSNIGASSRPFDSVDMVHNRLVGCAGLIATKSVAQHSMLRLSVEGNKFDYSGKRGFVVLDVRDLITVKNNEFSRMKGLAGWFGGGTVLCDEIHISGNTSWNNNTLREGDSDTDAVFRLTDALNAIVNGNVANSKNEYLTVTDNTNFVVGETVTGGTSGATAVVRGKFGTTEIHVETSRSGTFSAETITGGTSAASTAVSGTAYNEIRFLTFGTVTNTYMGGNVHLRSLANSGTGSGTNAVIS